MRPMCAEGDGNFHVFPPDDSAPMSTSLPTAEKVFSSYLVDYTSAAESGEIWNIHQICSDRLTGRIVVVCPPPKSLKFNQQILNYPFRLRFLEGCRNLISVHYMARKYWESAGKEKERLCKQVRIGHHLIITREGLILTLSILIGRKGGISSYILRDGLMRNVRLYSTKMVLCSEYNRINEYAVGIDTFKRYSVENTLLEKYTFTKCNVGNCTF